MRQWRTICPKVQVGEMDEDKNNGALEASVSTQKMQTNDVGYSRHVCETCRAQHRRCDKKLPSCSFTLLHLIVYRFSLRKTETTMHLRV